jgi:molecular chaperone DnaJ
MTFAQTCPACNGSGQVIKDRCSKCNGKGKERVEDTLTIDIPEGIDSGNRLRVGGRGSIGKSGNRGDLYVVISVKEDAVFVRHSDDVYLELPIFVTLSLIGGKIEIPTLRGLKEIEIKRNIKDKEHIVLRGEGIKNVHGGAIGNLVAQVKIVYPDKLSSEQEELLSKLHESFGNKNSPHQSSAFDEVIGKVKSWFKS